MLEKTFCSLLLAVFLCAGALADTHPIEEWVQQCMDEDPSTAGCIACAREGRIRWRTELDTHDRALRDTLSGALLERYEEYAEAWEKELEAASALNELVRVKTLAEIDGSMWSMIHAIDEMLYVSMQAKRLMSLLEETKAGSDPPVFDPDEVTDGDREAESNVDHYYALLGQTLGESAAPVLEQSRKAWTRCRDSRMAFLAMLYQGQEDAEATVFRSMRAARDHADYLRGLIADLADGGLGKKVHMPWSAGEEDDWDGGDGGPVHHPGEEAEVHEPAESACDFEAYVPQDIEEKLALHDRPGFEEGAKVLLWFPRDPGEAEMDDIFKVTAYRGGWFKVVLSDGTKGWTRAGNAKTGLRSYAPGATADFHARPDKSSVVVGSIEGEDEVTILAGEGGWVLVLFGTGDGYAKGWLEPEKQCPNPYTNCS